MRKIALLALTSYILILMSPIGFAEKVTDERVLDRACEDVTGRDFADDPALLTEWEEELATSFTEDGEGDGTKCGVENSISNMLEKGDCTAANLSITEITEPLGPSFELNDKEKIIDVYSGICCMLYEFDSENNELACVKTRIASFTESSSCFDNAAYCERRQWLIAESGLGVVRVFVKQAYIWGSGIVGFIAVTVIIVSGIQISVSGVSGDITQAKERIIQSIAGLVLLFLSGLILYTINPTFFT